jgi:hypothetical protein
MKSFTFKTDTPNAFAQFTNGTGDWSTTAQMHTMLTKGIVQLAGSAKLDKQRCCKYAIVHSRGIAMMAETIMVDENHVAAVRNIEMIDFDSAEMEEAKKSSCPGRYVEVK